jgi:hypothetical protein
VTTAQSRSPWPWIALASRFSFFALAQALIALVITALGGTGAWESSAAWWMLAATVANVASLLLLRWRFTREGVSYRDLWRFSRSTFWKDLALAGRRSRGLLRLGDRDDAPPAPAAVPDDRAHADRHRDLCCVLPAGEPACSVPVGEVCPAPQDVPGHEPQEGFGLFEHRAVG